MTTETDRRLDARDLSQLMELVKGSDSIELKMTLPESTYRSAAAALDIDPLEAQIRQVIFFDTPNLDLNAAGVVVRARRIQGGTGDSVVKLRPVVPSELPKEVRQSPNVKVEVDVMRGSYVCSASLSNALAAGSIRAVVKGEKPLRKLYSKEQRAFFAAHAPEGIELDDLSILGPIFVLKLKVKPDTFPRKFTVEMWLYPDGTRLAELSTKCLPGEGVQVAAEAIAFLEEKGITAGDQQQTKTKTALEFFSAELRGGNEAES